MEKFLKTIAVKVRANIKESSMCLSMTFESMNFVQEWKCFEFKKTKITDMNTAISLGTWKPFEHCVLVIGNNKTDSFYCIYYNLFCNFCT